MQDINQIQALSLTQNLTLGTYLPSLKLSDFNSVFYRLNGNVDNPGNDKGLKNMFGLYRADLSWKLLSYLGYGNMLYSSPSSGNRWWSTSLKNGGASSSYSQLYIQNNYVNVFNFSPFIHFF